MKTKNKIEIDLSVEDIKDMVYNKLRTIYPGDYSFNFKVVNKPYGMYDSCIKYEFDSVKIVVITGERE